MLRECVLLVSVCIFRVASLSGRGFFCRDPETGKLQAVNTTWPASSFCGNYHCKLRRKNITDTEYAPLRAINITNIKIVRDNPTLLDKQNGYSIFNEDVAKNIVNIDKKTEPDILYDIFPMKEERELKNDKSFNAKNHTDRFLTEKEIKSLTEILHTVKKSDLDAIVEIYNLAQDIYREIDKTSTDQVLEEAMNIANTEKSEITNPDILKKVIKNGHISYWYEPLSGGKIRPINIKTSAEIKLNVAPKPKYTVSPPTSTKLPLKPNQMRRMTDTHFKGPLNKKDFRKLPFYFPLSSFQSMASYKHEPKTTKQTSSRAQPTYKTVTYKPFYTERKYQKPIQPSILLPYPFLNINHFNLSQSQDTYHGKNFFDQVDSPINTNHLNPIKKHVRNLNNAVLVNPVLENFQDLEPQLTKQEQKVVEPPNGQAERRKPAWLTDSLSAQILDEVRAHIQEKQKSFIHPFLMRKKVKLERVGKVNLDETARTKRLAKIEPVADEELLEPELYEVYIEKTT